MIPMFIATCYLACLVLWIVAELRWSRGVRLSLGLISLLIAVPVATFLTFALTDMRNNRYFSHAIKIVVSESLDSLRSGDATLLSRLEKLDATIEGPMYENNQNLLEKADAFRTEGERIRSEQEEVETERDGAAIQEPARSAAP